MTDGQRSRLKSTNPGARVAFVTRGDIAFSPTAGRKAIEAQAARLRHVLRTPGAPAGVDDRFRRVIAG
jgi:hypothetical protein